MSTTTSVPGTGGGEVSPFAAVEQAFRLLTTGPQPLALDGSLVPGLPQRPVAFDELRARLRHPSCRYATRDAALNTVLDRARVDGGAWLVGLVGLLLPGLHRTAKPLVYACPGKTADIEAQMLAGLLEAIRASALGVPRPAARLVWAARRAGERLVRSEQAEQAQPTGTPASCEPHRPFGHPDLVLARAVSEGVLCADDADLIGATRLGEMSLADAAQLRGVAYKAAAARRARAEQALVGWLHTQTPGEHHDDECIGAGHRAGQRAGGRAGGSGRGGFVANGRRKPGCSGGGRPRQGQAGRRPAVRHHPESTAQPRR
jgi:hypothetical protein